MRKEKCKMINKLKTFLTSGLSSDEFFHTARCKSTKEIWKMLEVTHDGSVDVRRARDKLVFWILEHDHVSFQILT